MKRTLIYTLFFSLLGAFSLAQKTDSLSVEKPKYQPNFMLGIDVLNAGTSAFSERKLLQGFISSRIKKDWHGIAELGYDDNIYQKNGYDASVKGFFLKLGGFYMMMKDAENKLNGFYGGAKFGASLYEQNYAKVPVRGIQGTDSYLSFQPSNQFSFWVETQVGGRVQLFESPFYIDVNVQPRYLLYSTKQEEMKPMIAAGFGRSSAKFNMGFSWNLAYQF
ncbi:MAG: DUF6048 family protein [Bergeyella zoohelcum]|nr:DUF6048 family protein [Bergeyella zoohelcum]